MNSSHTDTTDGSRGWARTARIPWAVVCVVAAVLLGPAAVTANALGQANSAPMYHAVQTDIKQAYIPTDTTRRRGATA